MKYFLDTEFIEGTQKKMFNETKPTIDLISIGIVCEDGREYYAISKDFNLKEAWNKEWIRENVLFPIFKELVNIEFEKDFLAFLEYSFNKKDFKTLLNKYGKTNKQIAIEILDFINTIGRLVHKPYDNSQKNIVFQDIIEKYGKPQFYGYYSDYDWVVFCWLFGKMIDLPKGFPMYCRDLKQIMDDKVPDGKYIPRNSNSGFPIKEHKKYPKQINEHNALSDAKWNYELYKFLNTL